MNQFRSMLPRLADLYDRFVTDSVDNFFHGFPIVCVLKILSLSNSTAGSNRG